MFNLNIQGAKDKSKSTSNKESANFWNLAPDEIVEMILLYVLQQSENSFPGYKCETYASIKSTCRKWARIIEGKGPALLPKIYIDTWKPLGKPCNGKIIVSTRKLTRTFGKSNEIASQLSNCIGDKKWMSSWLILTPEKHSWYTIDRIFWKTKVCQPNQSSSQFTSSWLKNELYKLTEADREILESKDGWLNDNLMDAGQQLICKALGSLETYQSVLNCQKKESTYFPVSGDHIQLLHDASCHWLLAFTSSGRFQVYDSLRTNLTAVSKKYLKSLFQPLVKNGKLEVTFLPVDKQIDGFNCGLFASILLDGKSPVDARFIVNEMRSHFIKCLKDPYLYPFPTLEKAVDVSSSKPKFFMF